MVYSDLTRFAMKLAYKAHEGQIDKAGVPYVFHPIHLAEQMKTETECIVALLHDVVEDTDVTIEQLQEIFPKDVTDAIKLLTHNKDEDYMEYIEKIKNNDIAKKVKLADIKHNSEQRRLKKITPEDIERAMKYQKALDILEGRDIETKDKR